ncbi:MAG: 2Fe-2S iron-sulfur cluster-binding protein [Pseudomonadota bacterium]
MSSYQVTLSPTKTHFDVREDETILEAALRSGIPLPYQCAQGECGTCRAKILNGDWDLLEGLPAARYLNDGETLLCSSKPKSDLEIEYEPIVESSFHVNCQVSSVQTVTDEILIVRLAPQSNDFNFEAGQYLNLLVGEAKIPLSIASGPENERLIELHIGISPGNAASDSMVATLQLNASVDIELAFGQATLTRSTERPMLLIAGGTGFAPMKSIIESSLSVQRDRDIHLFWGARSPELLYTETLVKRWDKYVPTFSYTPVISEPATGWNGATGFVHEEAIRQYPDLSEFDVFLSGSFDMVAAVAPKLLAANLPRAQLFSDILDIIEGKS